MVARFSVPHLVPSIVPGSAGWTVSDFKTAEAALEFARALLEKLQVRAHARAVEFLERSRQAPLSR